MHTSPEGHGVPTGTHSGAPPSPPSPSSPDSCSTLPPQAPSISAAIKMVRMLRRYAAADRRATGARVQCGGFHGARRTDGHRHRVRCRADGQGACVSVLTPADVVALLGCGVRTACRLMREAGGFELGDSWRI